MLLRLSVRSLVLVVWGYSILFMSLGASDDRFFPFADISNGSDNLTGSCEACPVGTFADNDTMNCNCSCNCSQPVTQLTNKIQPCNCSGYCSGNSACKSCDYGFHANQTASTVCSPCEMGHFTNFTGAVNCTACPSGTFSNVTGTKSCHNCINGTFANKTGMVNCEKCKHGHYCNETEEAGTGCTWCRPCPQGTATTNAFHCEVCGFGQYNPTPGSDTCISCSAGEICNQTGCTQCKQCPIGKEPPSRDTGSYACVNCKAGTYRNKSTGLFCEICQPGFYQVYQGKTYCMICPEKFYCPFPSSEPVPCHKGANCPSGSSEPIVCANTLMEFDPTLKTCTATPSLYGIVVCAVLVVVLMMILVPVVVYCSYCRRPSMPTERMPLYPKEPIREPLYDGY